MIRVAICDNEKMMVARMEEMVMAASAKRKIKAYTDTFDSTGSLMEYIKKGNDYDIIYLDIVMPEMDGVEFARKLREENSDVMLIYVSEYVEYAVRLFDVDTFRFIKKPVDQAEFEMIFNQACDRIVSKSGFFTYTYNKNIHKIRLQSILYFESKGRIIHIVTTRGREEFYGKLDDVEERVRNEKIQFLRIHKSYLVSLEHVEKICYDKVHLKNEEVLRISEERQKMIHKRYFDI